MRSRPPIIAGRVLSGTESLMVYHGQPQPSCSIFMYDVQEPSRKPKGKKPERPPGKQVSSISIAEMEVDESTGP